MEKQEQKTMPMTMELAAAALAQRCRKDEDFRQRFKSDPEAVLQAEMRSQGSKLAWPQNMSVAVEENSVQRWIIPIPSAEMVQACKDNRSQTFTDEQLDQISAGEVVVGVVAVGVILALGGLAVGATLVAREVS